MSQVHRDPDMAAEVFVLSSRGGTSGRPVAGPVRVALLLCLLVKASVIAPQLAQRSLNKVLLEDGRPTRSGRESDPRPGELQRRSSPRSCSQHVPD